MERHTARCMLVCGVHMVEEGATHVCGHGGSAEGALGTARNGEGQSPRRRALFGVHPLCICAVLCGTSDKYLLINHDQSPKGAPSYSTNVGIVRDLRDGLLVDQGSVGAVLDIVHLRRPV